MNPNVSASESTVSGTWAGRITCSGDSETKSRSPVFKTDGGKAWLTSYGKTGETYESKLKKGRAKFEGVYKGIYRGEPFRKYIRATVRILANGDVKVSGSRGSRNTCYGILKKIEIVAKDAETIAKENAEKLAFDLKYLPGDWKGKAGSLVTFGQNVEASFRWSGDRIVGQIWFDLCLPAIELIVSTENDVLVISGDENMRSFSSNISPSFGSVNETSMYSPYNLVGDTSGCPGSERGFLRLDRQ